MRRRAASIPSLHITIPRWIREWTQLDGIASGREPYIDRWEILTNLIVGFGIGRLLCYSFSSGPKCIDPEEGKGKVLSLWHTDSVFDESVLFS